MKKWMLIPILLLLIILLSCQKQNKREQTDIGQVQKKDEPVAVAEKVRNNILTALDQLKQGNVDKGTELLLNVVLLTKPSESMPEGYENKILSAKGQFQQKNYAEAVEFISDALLIFKASVDLPDKKDIEERTDIGQEQKEEEPSPIAPIAEIMNNKILSALEQFKEGNADKGTILILEALMLLNPRTG